MRNSTNSLFRTFAAAALAGSLASPAFAADSCDDEIKLLREQITALDQKLRILERKQELKDEDAAIAAKAAAKVTVNDRGFTIASADGANSLRLRSLIQADTRWFFGDDPGIANNDAYVLRRARMYFEGTFNKNATFLISPEFAGSSPSIVDAYVNLAVKPSLQFRFGRFREPVGLEQLQSDSTAFFNERSLVSQLVPGRDLGAMIWGELSKGTISYFAGAFNGVVDGANNGAVVNADADKEKDLAARLFFQPFKNDPASPLKNLGFGLAGTKGRQRPAAGLPSYRTDGQQTAFSYRTQSSAAASVTNYTTVVDGETWRFTPQLYWYGGQYGLMAEYAQSTVNVRPNFPTSFVGSPKIELKNKAWQLAGNYVFTGETPSYNGVVPAKNFSLEDGTWGAFELVARYATIDFDDAAFVSPGGAYAPVVDPAANPTEYSTIALGLNWYLNKTVRASFDYFLTDFKNNVAVPTRLVLRNDEQAFISRVQVVF